ncbi:MAG TPA: metallophosphoesterase family protein [Bryobacteraceae bacterium]|nr:metallophosphoesterase family protein [Bryobacteraceae bacterium]
MRFLILSDIHANWEALQAVMAHVQGKYDQIVCLGDVVGYGADPDVVTEWVRENAANTIRGNHDKACAGLEDLEWFNPIARISAVWTQQTTKAENISWLAKLPGGPAQCDGFQMVHGSPLDEDEYVITDQDARQTAPYLESPITFFGHTHLQGGFLCTRGSVRRLGQVDQDVGEAFLELQPDIFYLLNPGSVGQPRDNDPRAAYAVYDDAAKIVVYARVPYDIEGAQKKIRDAGLPEILARRLDFGN